MPQSVSVRQHTPHRQATIFSTTQNKRTQHSSFFLYLDKFLYQKSAYLSGLANRIVLPNGGRCPCPCLNRGRIMKSKLIKTTFYALVLLTPLVTQASNEGHEQRRTDPDEDIRSPD